MRNIAAFVTSPRPSRSSHERHLFQDGLKSLRAYRLDKLANRTLPSAQQFEDEEAA